MFGKEIQIHHNEEGCSRASWKNSRYSSQRTGWSGHNSIKLTSRFNWQWQKELEAAKAWATLGLLQRLRALELKLQAPRGDFKTPSDGRSPSSKMENTNFGKWQEKKCLSYRSKTGNKARQAELQDWIFHSPSQQSSAYTARRLFLLMLLEARELKSTHLDRLFVRQRSVPQGVAWSPGKSIC